MSALPFLSGHKYCINFAYHDFMSVTEKQKQHLKATFLGLAIGDALGTTLEFTPRNKTNSHTDITGGGPFNMPPGGWTDDTSMALCLAESLVKHPDFNPEDLMNRFVNWWQHGYNSHTNTCFDIGITTVNALKRYLDTQNPYAGSKDPGSAGNGSLMRIAPVLLSAYNDPEKMIELAKLQSRTTHAAEECEHYCGQFVTELHEIVFNNIRPKPSPFSRSEISSSGYVRHTYEAANWAVSTTNSFKDALIAAVNLGDDADTVGAVTGMLAGAVYGYDAIPPEWLNVLLWREKIDELADQLIN